MVNNFVAISEAYKLAKLDYLWQVVSSIIQTCVVLCFFTQNFNFSTKQGGSYWRTLVHEGERGLLRKSTPFSHPTFLLAVSKPVGTKSGAQASASLPYITYPTVSWPANHNLCDTYLNLRYLHLNLRNITLHNVTPSLISPNPREQMCSIQISFFVVTFPSHITKEAPSWLRFGWVSI
jgi:hypothetical protein